MLSLLMLNPSLPGPFFYTFLFPVITVEETLGQVVMLRTKKESFHFVSHTNVSEDFNSACNSAFAPQIA
jgi:hypothetical protein